MLFGVIEHMTIAGSRWLRAGDENSEKPNSGVEDLLKHLGSVLEGVV